MSDRLRDQLVQLVAERTFSTIEQAVRSGGQVAQGEIDALNRLARLVEIHAASKTSPRRFWPLPTMLATTLLVVSGLLFARCGETEIELDVRASEVNFSVPNAQVLLENVGLASLGASGLSRVQLPERLDQERLPEPSGLEDDGAIRLDAVVDPLHPGSISIGALTPAGDTDVWLGRTDLPKQYRLSLRNLSGRLQVDIVGRVRISRTGAPSRVVDLVSPRPVILYPGPGVVDIDLVFLDLGQPGLAPQVSVRNIAFARVDELTDPSLSIVRRLSTIVSGTLYLESLNGMTYALRAGEALRFAQARGEIRTVRLEPGYLTLNFHGWVRGMRTGSNDSPRSLMPTCLEWLRARHGLELLCGTTLYVFTLLTAVVRWTRIPI